MPRVGTLMVGLLFLAACGGSGGSASQGGGIGSLETPHPLAVQVATDPTKTASALIGPVGGQVTATAASGAQLTLTLPAGALLSAHNITLTPLASMAGSPLKGGLLAGVQLGPDGLLLAKAATLKITLAAPPPNGLKAYGFGYRQAGSEFHLKPRGGSGSTLTLTVWHFSGDGVAAGSAGDAASQGGNPPSAPQDQVEQAQALGQQVVPLLLGWDAALTVQIGQSPPNLPLLDGIYQQTLAFESIAVAAGRPDLPQSIFLKLGLVLKTAADIALANCRSVPDASEGLRVIRWIEWAQAHPALLLHLNLASLESDVVRCLRFRLDFTTTVDTTFGPEAIDLSVEVKDVALNAISALPLQFAPGSADITYTAYKWVGGFPYSVAETTDRQFTAHDMSVNMDAVDAPGSAVDGMSVTVDFGDTTETITVKAPFPLALPLKSFYANGMQNSHRDSMVGPHLYRIAPWTAGSGQYWAEARQGCPCPSPSPYITYTQDTVFQLRHTPQ